MTISKYNTILLKVNTVETVICYGGALRVLLVKRYALNFKSGYRRDVLQVTFLMFSVLCVFAM